MSIFSGGSEISDMYLGSNKISEMYLGSNLIYSSGWPYETFRYSTDGGITWVDRGRPSGIGLAVYLNMRITHVELPDSLTTISGRSFENNRIKELLLPDSLIEIGNQAFRYNELTYVEFPETLEEIEGRAFRDNPNLAEVRISRRTSYTHSGTYATFDNHTNVITYSSGQPYEALGISTDGGVTWTYHGRPERLTKGQFQGMGITHVELPDSLRDIQENAFRDNDIESLDIPESVQTIGDYAFWGNELMYIEFPETLDSIGTYAFWSNPNLFGVIIGSRTTYRDNYTFPSYTNITTPSSPPSPPSPDWPYKTFRISKDGGVTWEDYGRPTMLGSSHFKGEGITHVELPDSLTSIASFAFEDNNLESLEIPASVKTIELTAFRNNKFTYIEFPETLDSIGTRAFRNNSRLSEVRVSYQTSYTRSGSSATFDTSTNVIRY